MLLCGGEHPPPPCRRGEHRVQGFVVATPRARAARSWIDRSSLRAARIRNECHPGVGAGWQRCRRA
eukprot:3446560-Prymnesium_polylepis.1